ncbi:MAG: glutamate racemase [Candidatus Muproteobacteria bacterium RBG_16_65_34]|uniref:Glutamate racemase n=1 Tax=Candidatus Muproteobacteria bacterium RBG_16_65_34 TaxID=1817760 RepID=A0A1F6TUD6_9PROT|nr:MAG: glutamate racemase [Candidatus Muproteobacteria bacterium RBG_16_65_34]
MTTRPEFPIGVFDSGVGGLTVARALMQRLPNERIFYFGDTARVPYGIKSEETIAHFALQIAQFLLEKQVKLLIVACNTMAAVAARAIADLAPVPVLDVIEAGAQAAAAATRNKSVGVIGTLATVTSGAYDRAIHRHDPAIRIVSQACPLLVPLVEEGWLDHPVTRLTAQEYLAPVLAQSVDTLVLGCTHYPLLKPLLQQVAGAGVRLVDSAETVAARTEALLRERGLTRTDGTARHEFFVTDVPQRFQQIGERFLGRALAPVHVVKW